MKGRVIQRRTLIYLSSQIVKNPKEKIKEKQVRRIYLLYARDIKDKKDLNDHKKNQVFTIIFHLSTNILLVFHVCIFASESISTRAATGSGEWIGDRESHWKNGDRIKGRRRLEMDMYTSG